MTFRFCMIALIALFLFMAYFLISHAYVFMRLGTALGFIAVVFGFMGVIVALAFARRLL